MKYKEFHFWYSYFYLILKLETLKIKIINFLFNAIYKDILTRQKLRVYCF